MLDTRYCLQCGTALTADAPGGHCLRCLFRLGLEQGGGLETLPDDDGVVGALLEEEAPGQWLGKYRLVRSLGQGGSGLVYLAEQAEPVRRNVALKILRLGMDSREALARFAAEKHALSRMSHPNIAQVFDAGVTRDGRPYFVMELISGIRVTDHCDQNALGIEERLSVFGEICLAVQHAHQKGIVHRDLKPSNVLVTMEQGRSLPKLIDFGIAKALEGRLGEQTLLTAFEGVIGTPAYMSPEQVDLAHLDVDTRSDIYSLGALLYELLTGTTAFNAKELVSGGIEAMRQTISHIDPPPPSARLQALGRDELNRVAAARALDPARLIARVTGDLDWIVMKCLEKDRGRRYATAGDLEADLERHLRHEPVLARPASRIYQLQRWVRRNRAAVAIGSTVAVGLVIALVLTNWALVRERSAERTQSRLRKEADAARLLLARTVDRLEFQRAEDLFGSGDSASALAYLARILRRNPANGVAAQRLFSALTERRFPLPTAPPLRHADGVTLALFTPDSRRVITVSRDNTARIWDAKTGQPMTVPMRHEAPVSSAQLSPDGRRLLTVSDDNTARVWDVATGKPVTGPLRHPHQVRDGRFSPDGRRVATAARDNAVRLWDVASGQVLLPPIPHADRVWTVRFSPDGRKLLTASSDRKARLWETSTGRLLVGSFIHQMAVRDAEFSSDGRKIVTASDDGTARVWDARTGQPLTSPLEHRGRVWTARFSPDGRRIVTASDDRTVRVWDGVSGRALAEPLPHKAAVRFAEFSPSGEWVITAWSDNSARIWDVGTGRVWVEPLRHLDRVLSAEFNADASQVVTASDDKTAQIWRLPGSQAQLAQRLPQNGVTCAEFGPSGQRLVTGAADGVARVWDAGTAQPITPPLRHDAPVRAVRISPDRRQVWTVSSDGWIRTWDSENGRLLQQKLGPLKGVASADFSADGRRVVLAFESSRACIVPLLATEPIRWLEHQSEVISAKFSSDGERVVTASRDDSAQIWEAQSGLPLAAPLKHDAGLVWAQFSPDGKKVLTASADETARVWDVKSGHTSAKPLVHEAVVLAAEFSPDGRRVATASADGIARVWDRRTGEALTEPLKHSDRILCLRFSPDGRRLATGSEDKTARVWDVLTGGPLTEPLDHSSPVQSIQFSSDGQRLATITADQTVRIWPVPVAPVPVPGWVPQLAEAIAGKRCNAERMFEPVPFDALHALHQHLADTAGDDLWGRWANWLFSESAGRSLSSLPAVEGSDRRLEAVPALGSDPLVGPPK